MLRNFELSVMLGSVVAGLLIGYSDAAEASWVNIHGSACVVDPISDFIPLGTGLYGGSTGLFGMCAFVETNSFPKTSVASVRVDVSAAAVSGYVYATTVSLDGTSGSSSPHESIYQTGWNALLPDVSTIWSSGHATDYAAVYFSLPSTSYLMGISFST